MSDFPSTCQPPVSALQRLSHLQPSVSWCWGLAVCLSISLLPRPLSRVRQSPRDTSRHLPAGRIGRAVGSVSRQLSSGRLLLFHASNGLAGRVRALRRLLQVQAHGTHGARLWKEEQFETRDDMTSLWRCLPRPFVDARQGQLLFSMGARMDGGARSSGRISGSLSPSTEPGT